MMVMRGWFGALLQESRQEVMVKKRRTARPRASTRAIAHSEVRQHLNEEP
jgi:hypothetical protein